MGKKNEVIENTDVDQDENSIKSDDENIMDDLKNIVSNLSKKSKKSKKKKSKKEEEIVIDEEDSDEDTEEADSDDDSDDDSDEEGSDEEGSEEDSDEDASEVPSLFKAVLTFDFNHLLFQGRTFSPGRAWTVLGCATSTIAAACYLLSESVMLSAETLDVQPYFTAVILGAAATSVPDTVLSYKDAIKGDYDDAVANAIGSNIFDICVALGLPLAIYSGLNVLQGNPGGIPLVSAEGAGAGSVQDLRIVLVILSVVIIGTFLSAKNERDEEGRSLLLIGKGHGWALLGIYLVWTGFVVSQMVG